MSVYSIEKIDGMRRTPQRVFPPNGLKYAKNILTSVENNIFQTACPIEILYTYRDISDTDFVEAIVSCFEGTETIFVLLRLSTDAFHFAFYDGSFTDLGSVNSEADTVKLLNVGSDVIIHPFGEDMVLRSSKKRRIYKKWKYTRNNVETENTSIYGLPDVPSFSEVSIDVDVFDSTSMTDDIPVVLSGTTSGRFYVMPGFQINGFESIAFEDVETDSNPAVENTCVRVDVQLPSYTSKLVSAVDIYLANPSGIVKSASKNISEWMFVDSIPMDRSEIMVDSVSCTASLNVITCSTKTWIVDQWKNFVAKIGGSYYRIDESGIHTLTVVGSPSGSTVEIYSRWIEEGNNLSIAKYITADEGESLIDRCGVSNLIVKDNFDYCPLASYMEYFKGFVWMADYIDCDDVRHRNRLISNVINSEGQSCYSVYNTTIYIEFTSNIFGLKAYNDYMFVFTGDGIYAVRFTPSQGVLSYSWSVKKVSSVIVPNSKYSSGYGNVSFLFDNYRLYTSDGYSVKLVTNDEINLIIADYTNLADIASNSYSILYCEEDGNIYLCLDEIILFRNGIIEKKALIEDSDVGKWIGTYGGEPVYFFDNYIKIVRLLSDKRSAVFDVQFPNTDLGTKEDKYFVTALIEICKGLIGSVIIEVYIDDTLKKTISLAHFTSYDQCFDIRLPKSNSRRFARIYFRIYGTTWETDGIDFQLKTLDVEVEPVRRTVLS